MIIVDFSQVMLSNLFVNMRGYENEEINEDLLRHFILNSLRSYRSKFKKEFGELVLACDDTNYWRKQIFPYYKARRAKAKQESHLNWDKIYSSLNIIRDEIKEYFPYRVVQVPTAEADDVIGTLVAEFFDKEPVLIVSGDKDFKQLHAYQGVKQYDPVKSKYITEPNPQRALKELIIRGDKGDGVPNFLSQDDVFMVDGVKQKAIRQVNLDVWLTQKPEEFCDDDLKKKRYVRNKKLVDLVNEIPEHIKETVMEKYHAEAGKGRSKLMSYFMAKRLRNLAEDITAF